MTERRENNFEVNRRKRRTGKKLKGSGKVPRGIKTLKVLSTPPQGIPGEQQYK